MNGKANVTKC